MDQRATSVLAAAHNRNQAPLGDDDEYVGDAATFDGRRHIDADRHAQVRRDRDRLHLDCRARPANRVRHDRANGAPVAADALTYADVLMPMLMAR